MFEVLVRPTSGLAKCVVFEMPVFLGLLVAVQLSQNQRIAALVYLEMKLIVFLG